MKLGILGGGQLGMMMCQEAKDLEISTFIFTDAEDSPATKFSDEHIICLLYTSPSPRDRG